MKNRKKKGSFVFKTHSRIADIFEDEDVISLHLAAKERRKQERRMRRREVLRLKDFNDRKEIA